MNPAWLSRVIPIAAIFSFRMLGLFMLIPVFSLYATRLTGANPTLIGIALGSYGLSQGLLQIPFGMLSDRYGRKTMITLGLILFALGSLIGTYTDSIYGMILARTLQGTGAIGSVLIALLADITPDEHRTKAMAVIGVTIGLSFSLAMIASPAITHRYGLSGIFFLTMILALFGLFILHAVIPTPKKEPFHVDNEVNLKQFGKVLRNQHLQRLNLGIFFQHLILTSTFFAVPMLLQKQVELGHLTQQWHFYFPLMVGSFVCMLPFIIFSEKKRRLKFVFLLSVGFTCLSQFLLAFNAEHWIAICGLMFTYFVAFNILEASLPSLVSRQANINSKGTAMGIYSSSQFLGIFFGGALSGLFYEFSGSKGIFIINGFIALIWFLVSTKMKPDIYQLTLIIPFHSSHEKPDMIKQLFKLPGVHDVVYAASEEVVYLRVNKLVYERGSAEKLLD